MNNDASFQRLAAVTSILAALLACGSIGLQAVVLSVNVDPFSHPSSILGIGANGANFFRWGMILDMFGYYLLLAPLALLLRSRLQPKGMNLIALHTFCGLAYMLIGALGAATLAAISPPLIEGYGHASGQQRQVYEVVFSGFLNVVYVGLWNLLESTLGGMWWVGIAVSCYGANNLFSVFSRPCWGSLRSLMLLVGYWIFSSSTPLDWLKCSSSSPFGACGSESICFGAGVGRVSDWTRIYKHSP